MGAAEGRRTVTGVVDAWNRKDIGALREHFADDVVWHFNGQELSLEEYLQLMQVSFEAFPDMRNEMLVLVAEGVMVAIRNRKTGTHQGDIPAGILPVAGDIPGSGGPVGWEESDFFRLGADGKIVEYWNYTDLLTVMQQLDAIPEDVAG